MMRSTLALVPLLAVAAPAVAQCANQYLPTLQLPGTDGVVRVVHAWDRDGPGPLPPVVALGGSFTQAGSTPVAAIAVYDRATGSWSALGTGVGNLFGAYEVRALATAANGDLLVGGSFPMANNLPGFNNIARWDGTSWSTLGAGTTATVHALAVLPNGHIVAAGEFSLASGTVVDRIARWDGVSWSALGVGMNNTVRALAVLPNGDLVAGGDFTLAGGIGANRVARWDGVSWSAMGTGMNASVRALATQGTTLFAGGDFSSAGGVTARGVASWNGAVWQANPNGLSNLTRIHAIAASATEVYLGGNAAGAGSFNSMIARFDGTWWQGLESNNSTASTAFGLALLPDGSLVTAGAFDNVNRVAAENVALGPTTWTALGALSGFIADVAVRRDGALVVTGEFTAPGIVGLTSVAVLDRGRWTSQQSAIAGSAREALTLPDGDVVVRAFQGRPGTESVFRWNGAVWTQLGPQLNLEIAAFAVTAGGDLVAGGYAPTGNHLLRWDGSNWVPIAPPNFYGIEAMTALPNGELLVSSTNPGGFTQVPRVQVWRWSGTWSQLGTEVVGIGGSRALAALPNGQIAVGGDFPVHRWDGASWSTLGAGAPDVFDLLALPDGDLLAAGRFTIAGTTNANRIARWDGQQWLPVGAGTNGEVTAMAALPDGDIAVFGGFGRVGGAPSPSFVALTTTCPATATPVGGPCVGSAGPVSLAATALPWTGGSFRATTTGFAGAAIGLRVLGLGPAALPLSTLHPAGSPNCSLLANADDLQLLLPAAGAASFAVPIPDTTMLAGVQVYCQCLQLEFGAPMQPTALNGSNALALTVGSF